MGARQDSAPPSSGARDRRKYRRIRAPLHYRFLGSTAQPSPQGDALDISLGGLRIYSDQKLQIGGLLNLEIRSEGLPPVTCVTEVVRVDTLDPAAPAFFAIGLRFIDLGPFGVKLLLHVLGRDKKWRP